MRRGDLEEAIALYRDHFLSDFYLDDSDEFEAWAQARRDYFRRRVLDAAGNTYLADFGIAKDLLGAEKITTEGTIVGTLDYTSPEQISGEAVTPQSDVYSLGAVLYEALTGERPFGDVPPARLLHSQLHEPLPLVAATRPDVPPQVDAVLQKATAKGPADRYDTVLAMAAAFRSAVRGLQPERETRAGKRPGAGRGDQSLQRPARLSGKRRRRLLRPGCAGAATG